MLWYVACHLCMCRALSLLHALPRTHFVSGWVLSAVARAHFELLQYAKAVEYYSLARKVCTVLLFACVQLC